MKLIRSFRPTSWLLLTFFALFLSAVPQGADAQWNCTGSIRKLSGPDRLNAGEQGTYVFRVTNVGRVTCGRVFLGLDTNWLTMNGQPTYNYLNVPDIWLTTPLAYGQSEDVTMTITAPAIAASYPFVLALHTHFYVPWSNVPSRLPYQWTWGQVVTVSHSTANNNSQFVSSWTQSYGSGAYVYVTYRNTGGTTWNLNGQHTVSASGWYTTNKPYDWRTLSVIPWGSPASIPPGSSATFRVQMPYAPEATYRNITLLVRMTDRATLFGPHQYIYHSY